MGHHFLFQTFGTKGPRDRSIEFKSSYVISVFQSSFSKTRSRFVFRQRSLCPIFFVKMSIAPLFLYLIYLIYITLLYIFAEIP